MDVERFRLLVDLAGVARNPSVCQDITMHMGGTHRTTAARRAHNIAKQKLREHDNGT